MPKIGHLKHDSGDLIAGSPTNISWINSNIILNFKDLTQTPQNQLVRWEYCPPLINPLSCHITSDFQHQFLIHGLLFVKFIWIYHWRLIKLKRNWLISSKNVNLTTTSKVRTLLVDIYVNTLIKALRVLKDADVQLKGQYK
jgi:hypothetical protein